MLFNARAGFRYRRSPMIVSNMADFFICDTGWMTGGVTLACGVRGQGTHLSGQADDLRHDWSQPYPGTCRQAEVVISSTKPQVANSDR